MKNIIHTLTRTQMRANPRRTLVTLIGVILSVAMLTAVFAGADSFLNLLYRQAAEDNGIWHGRAFETGEQVVHNLSQDDRVDQLGLAAGLGMAPLDDQNRWGAALYGVNQSFYQLLGVECLEGTLPAKENELAITRTLAEKTGWKLGEQVSLGLLRVWTPQGVDSTGAMTYRQTSGLGIMGLSDSYVIHSVGKNQFTITAIVDPGGFDDQNGFTWEPCFTALEDQVPADGLWCAYYTVNPLGQKLYDLMGDIQNWQAGLPVDAGGVGTIDLNRQLLLYYGMDYPGSLLLPAFYGLMAVTLLIILVGAVSLARNAFVISMTERTQMLGMLASVGATRAQKRQSVLYEAFLLGLIGIPLGLAAGCGGMAVALILLNQQVQELFQFSQPLYLSVRPVFLGASALLAVLTLAFSALQPALKASKVTPMDAIRGEGQIQLHSSDVKTGKLTRMLFGFPGVLALKNCKRNRGRYRAIVFSLALSVIMLLAGTGLSYYVDRAMGMRYGTGSPIATATITFSDPSLDTTPYMDELKALAGTGEARVVGGLQAGAMGSFTLDWADMSQEALNWLQSQTDLSMGQEGTSGSSQSSTVYPTLLVMEDEEFADWAGQAVSLNPDYLDCVMITSTYLNYEGSYTQLKNALNLQPGFSIDFAQEGGFADTWHVAALAEDFPYSGNTVTDTSIDSLTLQLVTSRSVFQAFLNRQENQNREGAYYWQIQYIHPESVSALTNGLQDWSLNNSYGLPAGVISAYYNTLAMSGLQRFGMLLQILCIGFVLLLCLVCMANIHNSLSTGMELRAREYGILRSVGITPADFRKMIWLESLFYGIKALCWSLPLGLGVLAVEYYAIRRAFHFPFCLPVGSVVLAIVLVLGVCWFSGLLTRRSLEEQTITQAIQKTIC